MNAKPIHFQIQQNVIAEKAHRNLHILVDSNPGSILCFQAV